MFSYEEYKTLSLDQKDEYNWKFKNKYKHCSHIGFILIMIATSVSTLILSTTILSSKPEYQIYSAQIVSNIWIFLSFGIAALIVDSAYRLIFNFKLAQKELIWKDSLELSTTSIIGKDSKPKEKDKKSSSFAWE